MKNVILLSLAMLCISPAFAQFGVKAGVNVSGITSSDNNIEDLKSKIGFQAGAMIKLKLNEAIAIQPEALYTRKGAQYTILGADVNSQMDYLDIPVVLVIQPLGLPVSFHVGPQFSYLLQTNVKYENGLFGLVGSYEVDRENFEDYDLGLVAGIALNFDKLFIELRYNQNLKNYEKTTQIGDLTIEPSSKHYGIQASAGFFF